MARHLFHPGAMDASLLDHCMDGVMFMDAGGTILEANAVARSRLGEVTGRHLLDLIPPLAATRVTEAMERTSATGARELLQLSLRGAGGEEPATLALSWLPSEGCYLALVRDARPNEPADPQIAEIAHDLNNILTVVSGHAELALEDLSAAHLPDDSARTIQRSAARARALTARLVALSRGERACASGVPAPLAVAGTPRVLLVDDDPAVRGLVERMLVRHGYHVIATGDMREAERIIDDANTEIDLLLTDLDLQPGSGSDLARAFADRRPAARVLYMTGSAPPGDEVVRPSAGAPAAPMIQKPFTSQELILSVRQLVPAPAA